MAIYVGTWKDGGVNFDPACFPLQEREYPGAYQPVTVAGNPVPDCTGTYIHAGEHDGLPYFQREDEAYVLWYDLATFFYYIATEIADAPVDYWGYVLPLESIFTAGGAYAGTPVLIYQLHDTITVTGICNPDITGVYVHDGTYNGLPYFKREDGNYYYFYAPEYFLWVIGPVLTSNPWPISYLYSVTGGVATPPVHENGYPRVNYTAMPPIHVVGESDPDCTGIYLHAGTYDSNPYWTREDNAFSIWSDSAGFANYISVAPGNVVAGDWTNTVGTQGVYIPTFPYTGEPQAAAVISEPATHGGICRLRIFGLRHGSGPKPDHYPAGPNYVAAFYDYSPRQWMARQTFGTIMKEYFTFPPFAPVIVTGLLTPDVTGTYGGLDFHEAKAHWYNETSTYHIWWDPIREDWLMALTYPVDPQNGDPYWFRTDPSPYGAYAPWQGAIGIATIIVPP